MTSIGQDALLNNINATVKIVKLKTSQIFTNLSFYNISHFIYDLCCQTSINQIY